MSISIGGTQDREGDPGLLEALVAAQSTADWLEDVTVQDLRRTHSSYSAAAGVDLRTLAARIGHTDLSMLQKDYAALVGNAEAEAADLIEDVFKRLTTKA